MGRLIDKTNGGLETAKEFAKEIGKEDQLKEKLEYLKNYACSEDDPDHTFCELYSDHAPYSFAFQMWIKDQGGEYRRWANGGLIFHGKHDGFGSGSAPTFSVCLEPTDGWAIHT